MTLLFIAVSGVLLKILPTTTLPSPEIATGL